MASIASTRGASTRLARGCPLCPAEVPREERGSLELASRMPPCRGDACHRLASLQSLSLLKGTCYGSEYRFEFLADGVEPGTVAIGRGRPGHCVVLLRAG